MSEKNTSHNWRTGSGKRNRQHCYYIRVNDTERTAIVRICKLLDISVSEIFREWLVGHRVKNLATRLLIKTLRRIVGLMRFFSEKRHIPELITSAAELQIIIDSISDDILQTVISDTRVPARDDTRPRDKKIVVWLDDAEHQIATSMKLNEKIPVTQAFRKFVIEKLIPTTEPTLMQREMLDGIEREFRNIACSYNETSREQYIDYIVAYAKRIVNAAENL